MKMKTMMKMVMMMMMMAAVPEPQPAPVVERILASSSSLISCPLEAVVDVAQFQSELAKLAILSAWLEPKQRRGTALPSAPIVYSLQSSLSWRVKGNNAVVGLYMACTCPRARHPHVRSLQRQGCEHFRSVLSPG